MGLSYILFGGKIFRFLVALGLILRGFILTRGGVGILNIKKF